MNIFKGTANPAERKQLLEMLDDVFFFEDEPETKRNFEELLPKLYREEYDPCSNNFIVSEDGCIKAAVGLYYDDCIAAGRKLKAAGIGNVAVTRDCRGKGYMIDCLNRAIEDIKNKNADYSVLGGDRQRYGYFGYEPAGVTYNFNIDKRNLSHLIGKDAAPKYTAVKVNREDAAILEKINALYEKLPFTFVREKERQYDILCSWRSVPYAVFEGEDFKGYFVAQKFGGVQELHAVDIKDVYELIMLAMQITGKDSLSISVPVYDVEMCEFMSRIFGGCGTYHSEMISIMNYKNFTEAFLAVKAERMPLTEGSIVMLIHGDKGDEKIELSVCGGRVSAEYTEKPHDIELEHREAIRLIAAHYSARRSELPAFAQSWFPVDFHCYAQDNV